MPLSKVMKPGSGKDDQIIPFPLNEVDDSGREKQKPADQHVQCEGHPKPSEVDLQDGTGAQSNKENVQADTDFGGALSKIERNAYELGFVAGEEAGRAIGVKNIENTRQILSGLIEEMDDLQKTLLKAAEQDILAIALAVAQRILGYEAALSRNIITKNIQEAIGKIGPSGKIIVRLSTADLEAISEINDRLSPLLKKEGFLKFEADADLSLGDCIVEGPMRIVDARLENQIAILLEALQKDLAR